MQIIDTIKKRIADNGYIYFTEQELSVLDLETLVAITNIFSGKELCLLPKSEIAFFEWLKVNAHDVWKDIWGDEADYLISIDLLHTVLDTNGRGFPICDLQSVDNYFFTIENMPNEEAKIAIDVARERFMQKEEMTPAQMLALEISLSPIDIWHFAYKHNIPLAEAKHAVQELVDDEALVHLTKAEYITPFINF